jgi:Na+-transporting methylmalonyl-CoA/oxaloacetate decarboxylase gamma subunit
MPPSFFSSLWITLIGMSLVFIAILALWGLMELMVRLTARYAGKEAVEESGDSLNDPAGMVDEPADVSLELKRKAAAAAVAVALAMQASEPENMPVMMRSSRSAWQAVLQGGQLAQRSNLYNRKNRGR